MIANGLSLRLFGISACLLASTVGREAIINGRLISSLRLCPYQVSVKIHGRSHVCGGGIIGDRFVLTAAYCVINETRHLRSRRIFITAGTMSLTSRRRGTVNVQVEKVFFPSEFHPTVVFNTGDIAVLKLVHSLQLEDYHALRPPIISKLELPRHYQCGNRAEITGYGWNTYRLLGNEEVGESDGQLRYAIANILSNDDCQQNYPPGAIESQKHLCAQITSTSSRVNESVHGLCIGDSGGALVGEDRRTVIAVVSKITPNCNERENPSIYTRVDYYERMIFNVMEYDRDPHMISLK